MTQAIYKRYTNGMALKMTTIRMEEELLAWTEAYAKEHRTSRSELIREFFEALREDRLRLLPRTGPSAFPTEDRPPGASPECPADICKNPTTYTESEA